MLGSLWLLGILLPWRHQGSSESIRGTGHVLPSAWFKACGGGVAAVGAAKSFGRTLSGTTPKT